MEKGGDDGEEVRVLEKGDCDGEGRGRWRRGIGAGEGARATVRYVICVPYRYK
ncbi:hypothetical protein Zm00014a_041693 [Zea mays]|uniref:Uncharacterized protein n=1 Tax=Zea mays TaxID=4577 RepID=A0A3L6ES91_MAIZE|nr:hypothetical protein Zm00014a_041693 [Zea mays]